MALCAAMSDEENAEIAEESRGNVTGEVVDTLADTPGQWMPIADAASRLACSQRTVWRLISRGRLRRRGVGGRAEVFVPTGMPPVGTPAEALVPASPATPDAVTLAVIDEMRAGRAADANTIASQAERLVALERENAVLRAQLRGRWHRFLSWLLGQESAT